jgi:molybdenum cofactor cytidylyltransferase
MSAVAGVVLAAGSSSRMGTNKLLLDLGGEPVVRRAARHALEAGLSPVIVVLGFEADRVGDALEGLDVTRVICPDHAAGMHASLRAGVARVPPHCAAAVMLLADMPLVTPAMSGALIARFRERPAPLIVSRYGAAQAPPTLYARALFPALLGLERGSGRDIVREHRSRAGIVDWPPALLADLDQAGDLERVRALLSEQTGCTPPS